MSAVDLGACVTRNAWGICQCGPCRTCGHQKHAGVHGPIYGHAPGSEPWGHEFAPAVRDGAAADACPIASVTINGVEYRVHIPGDTP
jgi:hypothetical protein